MPEQLEPATDPRTKLHPRVVHALNALAEELSASGLELFLFGSVAESYPYTRKGADLDIGLRSISDLSPDLQIERKRWAIRRLRELPTIRPLDIVDFDTVSERFKNLAMQTQRGFPLRLDGNDH